MTTKELQAEVERLRAQLAQKNRISFKVSTKGAVSVYGLGRFPVTLYKGQWEALLNNAESLELFIAANDALLSVKA